MAHGCLIGKYPCGRDGQQRQRNIGMHKLLTKRNQALQAQHGHFGLLPRRRRQAGCVACRLRG